MALYPQPAQLNSNPVKRSAIRLLLLSTILFSWLPLSFAEDTPSAIQKSPVESAAGSPPAQSVDEAHGKAADMPAEANTHPTAEIQKDEDTLGNEASELSPDDQFEDEYADENSNEIADPLSPFNKAMFHVNDKLYFWVLKPVTTGYRYVVPEIIRAGFSNAYDNLRSPGRVLNNLLQLRLKPAFYELARFLINSTVGVAGFKDIAKEVLDIRKQEADFGQTLGHYGIGHGLFLVWPILGPSSLRDTVGFVGDSFMYPLTYVSNSDISVEAKLGIMAHEKINETSFKLGDYELFKKAALNPYTAMRDSFVQYRGKKVEESEPLFKRNPR